VPFCHHPQSCRKYQARQSYPMLKVVRPHRTEPRLARPRRNGALILSFVIQGCVVSGPLSTPVGSGSPPPMNTPFDAYDVCIHSLPPLFVWEVDNRQQDCFKQTIKTNHLALPAGIMADQAYAKYKGCLNQGRISVGPFALGGYKANNRQYCFKSALQ
jgi:hypothetical protein